MRENLQSKEPTDRELEKKGQHNLPLTAEHKIFTFRVTPPVQSGVKPYELRELSLERAKIAAQHLHPGSSVELTEDKLGDSTTIELRSL